MDSQTNEPPVTPAGTTLSDVLLFPSESSSPWFPGGSIFSHTMLEDAHMDYQQDQEGPIILRSNRPDTRGQSRERDGWERQVGEHAAFSLCLLDVDASRSPNQYQPTVCPTYESSDQTAGVHPKAFSEGRAGTSYESKSKKFCHCSRSQCLKLYCECFASGAMCSGCRCSGCRNNAEHQASRQGAIKSRLARDPDAFRPKSREGCTCKRSSCLKNYCECYEANTLCSSRCRCVGCRWKPRRPPDRATTNEDTFVVEDVCSRLLAQARKADREAQRVVLNEFGLCLTEIMKTMFK